MKLQGLAFVLAISVSFSGIWACGKLVDEVGKDAGGLDATGYSPGDVMVADATPDVLSAPEVGVASEMDATPDSMRDVAVADVALDAPSGPKAGDSGPEPPSCAPGGPGMTNCGPGGSGSESCCTSLEVTNALESEASPFYRTYSNFGSGPTGEADPATASGLRLDKYLVTVGRFRQFVRAWSGGYYPSAGSGKHMHLNGGSGLANSATAGTYETGWDATDWNNVTDIDPTTASLQCGSPYDTWTASAGSNENLPINCVTWFESYAFCIWDGGFLPSDAEWEYAASAGNQQREYPWGTAAPGTANQYAIYGDYYTASTTYIAPVGRASMGAGYWGQFDLAGELWEWNVDWYNTYVDPCTDCAYLPLTTCASFRVIRGGLFDDLAATYLLPSYRGDHDPSLRDFAVGFRCARTPVEVNSGATGAGGSTAGDAGTGIRGDAGDSSSWDAIAPVACEPIVVEAGAASIGDAEVPLNHRPTPACCPSQRGPGPSCATTICAGQPYPCGVADGCSSDSQCTEGVNGRCFPFEGLIGPGGCSYDQCFTDSNCGSNTPCICRSSSTDNSANVCDVGGNCAVDSDCGPGGYCSPSMENCPTAAPEIEVQDYYSGPNPYYCHKASDLCVNDSDCPSPDAGIFTTSNCSYNAQDARWECREFTCLPP